MKNNDILRRLRYIFDISDSGMMKIFSLAEHEVSRAEISDWLKKEDDPAFQPIYDKQLATFLNGFISLKRGKKDGPQPKPEKTLSNNLILRKLKIALSMKTEDMLDIFDLADIPISKHELSAFFRHPDQSQFRLCKDQYLRNFLYGLQQKYRPEADQP
ncbi:MAG: DUF1456 family protein [Bacteroidetes bacterium]|nr:DUF1456 family protein [Bacteroidota bacterium]